jgi:hypothetical protein
MQHPQAGFGHERMAARYYAANATNGGAEGVRTGLSHG